MREDAKEGREVDMVQNFNLATFDIISDLSLENPLVALGSGRHIRG
jgi:hypothetical protein